MASTDNLEIHINSIMYKKIEDQQQTIDNLTKGLKDIKSQLFDVNNCDTVLTLAIDQLLTKNK